MSAIIRLSRRSRDDRLIPDFSRELDAVLRKLAFHFASLLPQDRRIARQVVADLDEIIEWKSEAAEEREQVRRGVRPGGKPARADCSSVNSVAPAGLAMKPVKTPPTDVVRIPDGAVYSIAASREH